MTRRSRRNPTGSMGIDMNSALLGAGVGAIAVYLLTKKSETPAAGAYLPAGAPADEPWMRAMGYKQRFITPFRVEQSGFPDQGVAYVDAPARYFSLDAKSDVYSAGTATTYRVPYMFTLIDVNGSKRVVGAATMVDGRWIAPSPSEYEVQVREFLRTGVSRQTGPTGWTLVFGDLKELPFRGDVQFQNPRGNESVFVQPEGRGSYKPQMRSPIPNAMLRWK